MISSTLTFAEDDCMKRTYAAEELFGQRKYKEAQELSEAILKSCKPNYNIVILMGRSQQV